VSGGAAVFDDGVFARAGEVALVTVSAGAAPAAGTLASGVAVVTASDGADEGGFFLVFGVALDRESAVSPPEPPE
jgi:hypothetical protein